MTLTSFKPGLIDGVSVTPLERHADGRGWLAELWRCDDAPSPRPAMAYLSVTRPGEARGPHEHQRQSDRFVFAGPGTALIRLWDRRADSPTAGCSMTLHAGEDQPISLVAPPGVVHGYRNDGPGDLWVINLPDALYRGEGRAEPVDEIRWEDDPDSPFSFS